MQNNHYTELDFEGENQKRCIEQEVIRLVQPFEGFQSEIASMLRKTQRKYYVHVVYNERNKYINQVSDKQSKAQKLGLLPSWDKFTRYEAGENWKDVSNTFIGAYEDVMDDLICVWHNKRRFSMVLHHFSRIEHWKPKGCMLDTNPRNLIFRDARNYSQF